MKHRQRIASRAWAIAGIGLALTAPALADPCHAPLPPARSTFGGPVTYIVDGDGLCVGEAQGGIEVRLGDFNAPELREPGGAEAKAALAELTLGKTVECIACVGARGRCRSYDRVIATCTLNGVPLGDLMRARGIKEGGR